VPRSAAVCPACVDNVWCMCMCGVCASDAVWTFLHERGAYSLILSILNSQLGILYFKNTAIFSRDLSGARGTKKERIRSVSFLKSQRCEHTQLNNILTKSKDLARGLKYFYVVVWGPS